jgi:hypothetical protein
MDSDIIKIENLIADFTDLCGLTTRKMATENTQRAQRSDEIEVSGVRCTPYQTIWGFILPS